jgi:hypothetical protein
MVPSPAGKERIPSLRSSQPEDKEPVYNNSMQDNKFGKFDKLFHLYETCTTEYITECTFLNELVSWMPRDLFDEFYEHTTRLWGIKSPEELDEELDEEEV